MEIPIRALELTHILGEPCKFQVAEEILLESQSSWSADLELLEYGAPSAGGPRVFDPLGVQTSFVKQGIYKCSVGSRDLNSDTADPRLETEQAELASNAQLVRDRGSVCFDPLGDLAGLRGPLGNRDTNFPEGIAI